MGKRANKFKKRTEGIAGYKRIKTQWNCMSIPDEHPLFREYYRIQLQLGVQDFQLFWAAMKQKLPVVFRVNPNCPNHEAYCSKISDVNFMKNMMLAEEAVSQVMKEEHGDEKHKQQQEKVQQKQLPKLQVIKWYPPGNIVYTANTTKKMLKKDKSFSEFHRYIQQAFDSGLISRQQLVSMLPPLYLDIKSNDIVLDMCAAPGSKTSQILQFMYGKRRELTKGCVIANDADYSRAQMLIHQLHRMGTTGMVVINHAGQFMPELYTNKVGSVKQKFQFDKILCDVPCSGDGATRKIPIKWANWHTSDGMVLHPLQLSILMKGINILKKGGYLVYSTCSLNPIENEAVISALFQKVQKGLQIIDIHPMFGVKGRRGLLSWKVLAIHDNLPYKYEEIVQEKQEKQEKQEEKQQKQKILKQKYLKQYKTEEDAKSSYRVKATMFPRSEQYNKKINLDYSMRILPHDQNTGGFYVALLKKNQEFQWKYSEKEKKKIMEKGELEVQQQFLECNLPKVENPIAIEQEEDQNKNPIKNENENEKDHNIQQSQSSEQGREISIPQSKQNYDVQKKEQHKQSIKKQQCKKYEKKKQKGSKYETFINLGEQQFESIKKFYGVSDQLRKLLYIRTHQGENTGRKVLLVSEGVRKFLQASTNSKIKLVNMGCQVFQKGKQSFAGNQCLYRLCQDGIHFILDQLHERKLKVGLQFFKKMVNIKSLTHEEIGDEVIRNQIREINQGSFCIYMDELIDGRQVIDAMVLQNFKNSVHVLVSNQDQASLKFRYL